MSERDLQSVVIDAADLHGWLVFHDTDPRRSRAGFPDLVLVKPPRVLFVELKTQRGRVRPDQRVWLDALAGCDVVSSGLVRPADLDRLLTRLAGAA